jgi:DNA invertase Pin-like site-specific DNA recombinase
MKACNRNGRSQGTRRLIRAAGYLRASTDDQEGSCPRQRDAILRYAERHGYTIVRWYSDDGISGTSAERPGFLSMAADCESRGDFDAVLVLTLDRFARMDPADFFASAKPFIDAGVQLVTTDEGVKDWDSTVGQVMISVGTIGKIQYVRDLAYHVAGGLLKTVTEHKGWPSQPPYGYRIIRVDCPGTNKGTVARLDPDPDTAPVVRRLFEEYAAGNVSIRALAFKLNAEGVPTPLYGNPRTPRNPAAAGCAQAWGAPTVKKLLANPAYVGDTVFNRQTVGKHVGIRGGGAVKKGRRESGKLLDNDESEWVKVADTHEPIIDRETFARVQSVRQERRRACGERRSDPSKGSSHYLLTNVIRCAACGCAMVGKAVPRRGANGGGEPGREYVCNGYRALGGSVCKFRSVPESVVVEAVADEIFHHFLQGSLRKTWETSVARRLKAQSSTAPADLARLEKEIRSLDSQITRGEANLAVLPADVLSGAVAKVRDMKARRETLGKRREQVRKAVTVALDIEGRVRAAADRICYIGGTLVGQAAFDRKVFQESVERIDVQWREVERPVQVRRFRGKNGKVTVRRTSGVRSIASAVKITFKPAPLFGADLGELMTLTVADIFGENDQSDTMASRCT